MEKVKAMAQGSEKLTDDELEEIRNDEDVDNKEEEAAGGDTTTDTSDDELLLTVQKRKQSLKDGDYIIQVHIIEARELKGRGWNDMSDPVVFVECMHKKKSTEIKKKCINCVYDQVLFFEFKDLDSQQINEGKCNISVYDANSIMRNVLIGSYEFDLATIYFNNTDHEVYKQWIALYDTSDEFEGIQGYLKVSIVVLGPNDEQKTHKLVDEDEEETNLLSVLIPPSIEQIPYLLSISIYEFKNLLTSDLGLFSTDVCDPFCWVQFGAIKLKSPVKKGRHCDMLCELQIPVMEPIMAQSIVISVYDWNTYPKRNDRIGSIIFDYAAIKKNLDEFKNPKWYSLYGAQLGYQRGVARRMNQGFIEGTAYRGECLISLNVTKQTDRPKKGLVDIGIKNELKPKLTAYVLKCDLYEGCEIHKNTQMHIEISIGAHTAKSNKVKVKDGRCEWFQVIESENSDDESSNNEEKLALLKGSKNKGNIGPITMPIDIEQCPDIFIYLCCSSNKKRISYLRIPFKEIYDKKWKNPPTWYSLKEDEAIDALDENIFPGSVLLALNAGRADDMPSNGYLPESRPFIKGQLCKSPKQTIERHRSDTEKEKVKEKEELSSFGNLTVYIQQAHHLPSMDKNGRSDPYVKLKILDKNGNILSAKTKVITESLNPKWYQSFTFNNIPIGETLKIRIFDNDKLSSDDLMGQVDILLITQSNQAPGQDFDVKNWFFINDQHPDSKLQCRFTFKFLSKSNIPSSPKSIIKNTRTSIHHCCEFGQPTKKSMQLRVRLYQARNLQATDSNGLCDPYVIIRCCGGINKSSICNSTVDPEWYETLVLNILLPQPLSLSPDIHLQIFDYDKFSKDDIVGRLTVKPIDIYNNNDKDDPVWYQLNENKGEILISFKLIQVSHLLKPILPNLKPKTTDKWLQIIVLGLRDLNSIFGVHKPYLKFCINGKTFKTKKSNQPSSMNPNFLQILKIKIAIPDNVIFAPSLRLIVKDSLFGGVIRRNIGNASISLQDLLQPKLVENDEEEEEEKKQDEPKEVRDTETIRVTSEQQQNTTETKEQQNVNADIVIDVNTKDEEKEVVDGEDNVEMQDMEDLDDDDDANSTSPLLEEKDGDEVEEEEESFDLDAEQKVDMTDDVPHYMVNRKIIDNELEDEISMTPFLEIPLFTGQINSKFNHYRKIGYFKGLIEVTDTKKSSQLKNKINIKQLLQPKNLFIRLYILRGIRLTPKDNDGSCDPYLVIKFGKNCKISTRNRYIKNTLNPSFHEAFEIPCTIPGTSTLSISVMDWDGIGDDLVGTTCIDVEDRWFSKQWQKLTDNDRRIPLEIRTLHSNSSSFAQGKLELWLEILTDIEIKKQPILDISPPSPAPYELRVIIWQCKDVTIKDQVTHMNDLYITGYLDGTDNKKLKKQTTDLHFRSQKGFGSFNWRMKFNVNLPCLKPPRFRIQIWDKDYFSMNDSICECYLSLSGLFKLAVKKQDRVIMKYRGKQKFWVNELRHSNFEGNQGKIQISIECMPSTIAQQLPAGFGRSEPNMNPFLPEPEGRAKFSIFSPLRSLRNLLGDKMYYKLCIGFIISALTSFLVLIGPTLASTLMAKAMTGV